MKRTRISHWLLALTLSAAMCLAGAGFAGSNITLAGQSKGTADTWGSSGVAQAGHTQPAGAGHPAVTGDIGTETMDLGALSAAADKGETGSTDFVPGCPITVLPNNASTSGNERAPNSNFLFGRSVWLITASELAASGLQNGAVPGSIGFHYLVLPGATATGTLIVYLQNTGDTTNLKSATWATAITGMTPVSSGSVTLPNTTAPFDIPFAGGSPFTYTGGGLYVAFDWSWAGPTTAVNGLVACTTTLASGLLGNQSNASAPTTLAASNFRPETRLSPAVGVANDVSVDQVMSVGVLPSNLASGQNIQAVVTNRGTNSQTNLAVTLNVAGAQSFSDLKIVPSLAACGGTATVTFAPFTPTAVGSGTVTASVPADDLNTNNSKVNPLSLTVSQYHYKYPGSTASGGVGFNTGTGQIAAKFSVTSATQVDTVNVEFFSVTVTTYKIAIYGDAAGVPGTLLYEDPTNRTVAAPGAQAIRLPVPVPVGPGNFYVAIEQTAASTNMSYSFDTESPLRGSAFFISGIPSTTWTDLAPANPFKANIGATLGACIGGMVVDVTPDSASACEGGSILYTCNVTGGGGTRSYQWTENGIDIGGANGPTYLATHAGVGAFTYNCRVTDDAACTNVQDATPSSGTWLANAGPCSDGNACTLNDTCNAGACVGAPISCDDSNACTNDVCNPGTGLCSHPAVNCDDSNACTTDSCNVVTGCVNTPPPGPIVTNLKIGTTCSPACTDKHTIVWDPVPGFTPYDILYGYVETLHASGVTASTGGCLGENISSPSSDDIDTPGPNQGFWYMVRARSCGGAVGTYNEGGNQPASRDPLIPAPPTDCNIP